MCVLAFAWKAHPRWRLVLIGNRDEFHDRPAAALATWDAQGLVSAGRDLQSGGTWLGVSAQGRLAVVTNLRGFGGPDPDKVSRGALVADYLRGESGHANMSNGDLGIFNPFNLIVAEGDRAQFLSNQPNDLRSTLAPGVYGLSNGTLDEPWPKTLQLKGGLLDWIVNDAERPEQLLDLLRQDVLPDTGLASDEPSEIANEPALLPIFIHNLVYGTRCSTVVAIDVDGAGTIIERRYGPDGNVTGETTLPFSWPC